MKLPTSLAFLKQEVTRSNCVQDRQKEKHGEKEQGPLYFFWAIKGSAE